MQPQDRYRDLIEKRDFNQLTLADAEAAAAACPEDALIQSIFAERLLDRGNVLASKSLITRVLEMEPNCAAAYGIAAQICIADADLEGAKSYIEQGFQLHPHARDVISAQYCLSLVEHDVDGAAAAVDLMESHLGLHISVLARRAVIAFSRDQGSAEAVQTLVEWFPGTEPALTAQSQLSMQSGHCERAVDEARQATSISPTSASTWTVLATALLRAGQMAESERAAQKAVDLNPMASNVMRILAMVASARGNVSVEATWLNRADALAPWNQRFRDLKNATAALYAGREGGYESVASLRKSFPICKRPAETALFIHLRNHKKWEAILELADEIIAEGRHHVGRTYAVRVAALRNLGRLQEALCLAEEAASEFSHVLAVQAELGMTLSAASDPRAKNVMRDVSGAKPTHPSEAATTAIHLMLEGHLAEADELLIWAEKNWPHDEAVKKARKALTRFQWARARSEPGSLAAILGTPLETTTIDGFTQRLAGFWQNLRRKN